MVKNIFWYAFVLALMGCDLATWQAIADNIEESKNRSSVQATNDNSKFILNVSEVLDFNWISGNQEWKEISKERLYKSKFILYENKKFEAILYHDDSTSNYLSGNFWYRSDGIIDFEASYNTSTGTGSGTNITITGTYFKDNSLILSFKSTARYQATVNSTYFGNSVSKAYTAKLRVFNQ